MKNKINYSLPTNRPPVHPGEILLEEFMAPFEITQKDMADRLKISRKHLSDIVHQKKPISLEIAHRLSKCFETSIDLWTQGQLNYDVWHALNNPSREVKKIKPFRLSE